MAERDQRYYRAFLEHHSVSRRGLFRGIFSGVKKASENEQIKQLQREHPRPPGAVEEALFVQLCQSCDLCKNACPEQVIDILESRPVITLDYNHCSQCTKCSAACPSGALASESKDIGLRPFFLKSCINCISGNCQTCVDSCPQQAITVSQKKRPELEKSKCDGCGRCRSACYVSSIEMKF
ncbi:4Fe-4S dicluster domain-containing protein [Psychromonas ossibalaenae]|uniref:4Fe-4S dicluster domain-containing protein n=1 Tax=Psychromonas ossibalaenae TaxID=444922 RepID=UPI00037243AB|nr:4Fe-4S dicluster domain-containing protein [Psychromonas ossibalaenae]